MPSSSASDRAFSRSCVPLLGPVRATESHPGARPLGWERFSQLREGVSLPIYAIGGMKPGDVATVRRHGGQGVAGIRHLWPR